MKSVLVKGKDKTMSIIITVPLYENKEKHETATACIFDPVKVGDLEVQVSSPYCMVNLIAGRTFYMTITDLHALLTAITALGDVGARQ